MMGWQVSNVLGASLSATRGVVDEAREKMAESEKSR